MTQIEWLETCSADLRGAAGTGTVAGNLAHALTAALSPTAMRIIGLVCSRDPLLARLRMTTPAGIPVAAEITKMIATYLTAERGLGRVALEADVDALAVILVGGAYLRASEQRDGPLDPGDLRDLLKAVIDEYPQARRHRADRG